MSFQDMGKKGKGGANRTQHTSAAPQSFSTKASVGAAPASGNSVLGQISEGLNQYQRNVGILDKIVQQINAASRSGGGANAKELQLQYNVQVDVVTQLEGRVKQQLSAGQANAPQIIKLKRDFERVQGQVNRLKADAERLAKQIKSAGPASGGNHTPYAGAQSAQAGTQDAAATQQQMQMQMQQDRLAEEMMREREEEIRNINKGMHQVHEIYKDLAHIVGSQQEQIDTIETQMEDSRANAEQGLKQVEKANEKYGNQQCTIC